MATKIDLTFNREILPLISHLLISFPSFNVNQVSEVRSGAGRVAKAVDFFHNNRNSATEISVSGVLSNTAGHNLLLENIMQKVLMI